MPGRHARDNLNGFHVVWEIKDTLVQTEVICLDDKIMVFFTLHKIGLRAMFRKGTRKTYPHPTLLILKIHRPSPLHFIH